MQNRKADAVSEIIATVLLLAVAVSVFSVIYVVVLSSPMPSEQSTAIVAGDIIANQIVLTHQGGRSLNISEESYLIQTTAGEYTHFVFDDFNENGLWDIGEQVRFIYDDLTEKQVSVTVVDVAKNDVVLYGVLQEGKTTIFDTVVNPISPYEQNEEPLSISASNTSSMDSVTLWYDYSFDNETWNGWDDVGTDNLYDGSWQWDFTFLEGYGYYRFFSIGRYNGEAEQPPESFDTSCFFNPPLSLNTSVQPFSSYQIKEPFVNITATGDPRLDNVSLYYQFSSDNTTWDGNRTIGEVRIIKNVGSSWSHIDFWNEYETPVIVPIYHLQSKDNNEACVRINNVESNGCDIKIQNPGDDHSVTSSDVHIIIMEQGYHFLNDGRKIEAYRYNESDTAENGNWGAIGTFQSYSHEYENPVVLGAVMSYNDFDWSVSYFTDGSQANPPDAEALYTSKHVGEDTITTRASETIGYIVIEQGTGRIEHEIDYEAMVGSDSVDGTANDGYSYSLSDTFSVGIATQGGMDGSDGSFAVLYGDDPVSSSITVACEEDTIKDTDRAHTNEQMCYWVFSDQCNITCNQSAATSWTLWNHSLNPDESYPWSWNFTFPEGPGYYQFYSIGMNNSNNETAPESADERCNYTITSKMNNFSSYLRTESSINLSASASSAYDNISLYYRFSEDNLTWSPISINTALLQGSSLSQSETNLNQESLHSLQFDTVDFDQSYYSFSVDNPTKVTVLQDGDYLISFTLPMRRIDSKSQRTCLQSEIYVNGIKQDVGVARSSYIRHGSDHSESSNHHHVLLENLSAHDFIEIKVKGVTSRIGNSYIIETTGFFSLYIERVPESETVFSGIATETTDSSNLNQNTAYEMKWISKRKDNGFQHSNTSNAEQITLEEIGNYLVYVNIPLGSDSQRTNIEGTILLDDAMVDGGKFEQGYIRNADDHSASSIHWTGIVSTSSLNEVLSISVEREANSGTVTVDEEKATVFIQKLPNEPVFISKGSSLSTGTDWNPSTKTSIQWTDDVLINNSLFSHSPSSDSHEITVLEDGDYHLVYNGAFSMSSSLRPNNKIFVEVNGYQISGAETKTNYMRNANDHDKASSCLSFLLTDLSSGDNIIIYTEREAHTPRVDDYADSLLMLWKKQSSSAHNWTLWENSTNPDDSFPWEWDFTFPHGDGYYEFASVAKSNGYAETFPIAADTRCLYQTEIASCSSWRFNEDSGSIVYDSYEGNNGTIHGASWGTGINGSCLQFNGSSDYVEIPASHNLNIEGNQLSVEAWINWGKNPNVQTKEMIVYKSQNDSWHPHYNLLHTTERFGFGIITEENHESVYSSTVIEENNWYHLVGTYNGSHISLYVNGVLERVKELTGDMKTSFVPVYFGSSEGNNHFFKGKIDNIAIYDSSLPSSQILQRYHQNKPVISLENMSAQWHSDRGSGSLLFDTKKQYNGTIHGATWETGLAGSALSFDGTNDYVSIDDSSDLMFGDEITFEAWVKPAEHKTAKILQKGDWDGHGIGQDVWNGWNAHLYIDEDQQYSLDWGEGRPSLNQWYHLAMTYDESMFRLFVNGVEKDNMSISGALKHNTRDIAIASDAGTQKFFDGMIDEMLIYNQALTSTEIIERYNRFKP